jgi:hypothetical protein
MSQFIINLAKSTAIRDAYKRASNGAIPDLFNTHDPILSDIITNPGKHRLTPDDMKYVKIIRDDDISTIEDYDELPIYLGHYHYLPWNCIDIKPVPGQDKRELNFIDFDFLFNLYENIDNIIFAEYFNEWHDKSHLFAKLTDDNGYIYIVMDKSGSTIGYHDCLNMQVYYNADREVLENLAIEYKRDVAEDSDYDIE